MTDAEYTEQAIEHLADLEDHVADRVMNKVDEDILVVEAVGHRRNVYDRHLPP